MSPPRRPKALRPDPLELVALAYHSPWTPTEQEFTDLFLEIAERKGWARRYHTHDSRRSPGGFPDWVLVHPGQRRVLFVELKGFAGFATEEQRAWLGDLATAGAEAYLIGTTKDYGRDAAAIAELLSRRPPARSAAA